MLECDQSESLATQRKGCRLVRACCSVGEEPTISEGLSVASAKVQGLRETIPPVRGAWMCAVSPQRGLR
jgi:hypothetical protein